MAEKLFIAFSLMLVVEGMMPFLAPSRWRETMLRLMTLSDQQIRVMGLVSMLFGVALLYIVN